jgi:hypothetical protein
MKRMLLALLLGLPGAVSAETYSLIGHWEGAVVRLGAVQPIQVDFRKQEGKLVATADVPERGLVGMPAETVEYNPPALRLKFLYGDAAPPLPPTWKDGGTSATIRPASCGKPPSPSSPSTAPATPWCRPPRTPS